MKIASSLSVLSAVAAVLCCPAWVAAEAPPAVRVWRLPRGAAVLVPASVRGRRLEGEATVFGAGVPR